MDNFLTRLLRHVLLAGCLGVAGAGHAENATGLLGIYSFADHSSMHFRTEPLMDFLQQRQVRLRLDVSNTYDELLLRAVRRDYLVCRHPCISRFTFSVAAGIASLPAGRRLSVRCC
jgi:hypothetical protein